MERLPWRLAALAGLLVGVISGISGTDLWVCLLRVGLAFALFFVLGTALRAALRTPSAKSAPGTPRPPDSAQELPQNVQDKTAQDNND